MDKKKYSDFLPKADGDAVIWLGTHAKNFPEVVAEALPNMSTAEIMQYVQDIKEWIDAIRAVDRLNKEKAAAVKLKNLLRKKTGKKIRDVGMLVKLSSKGNKTLSTKLDVIYKAQEIDTHTIRPTLKAKVIEDVVELHFHKEHKFGITVFCRKPGGEWIQIGEEFESPFVDKRPLAEPFQPEIREYMAMYNNIRSTIGLQSDIVKVICGPSVKNA